MGSPRTYQAPLRIAGVPKRETRTQFAALCYRQRKSGVEVLLLTSRDTKRWIIPKGWPMDGLTPADAAAQEAWEEGGVKGNVHDHCIGIYSYTKRMEDQPDLPCIVAVFPVEVKKLDTDYPEADLRRRKWFTPKKAASRVKELELKQILREFDPSRLR
ncbi:NUDIX domain-containing protein [Rhodophyticola porphyridii]|uniref:NUDIX domain-containing protein n=1 Tax=Rhodophyticola porphyridii TaxID=1852017 RepID=A0A3L9YGC1_9RHOB|nr:NUDIX hydrolase [Boseongicola sp. H5]MBO6601914.1 NUDIX hydrolase [Roseicyclus sp.]MBO6623275.1 NUDIX hydrolase [Roseicyclus sp.]MBO6922122.1 NUDIX hydrolase [Roseicyclus sp.]RMA41880.1 NUDIX domain-containing protein [Rhodophyticola porphyridii]